LKGDTNDSWIYALGSRWVENIGGQPWWEKRPASRLIVETATMDALAVVYPENLKFIVKSGLQIVVKKRVF